MVLCGVPQKILISIWLLSAACATTVLRGATKTAQTTYEVAMEDLDDGLYPEAISGFTELKTKYPYSKYAALADLRIADTNFQRGKYIEAVDAYRAFLKYHPSHDEATYAMFRIGESYFEQIPDDWWFLPPSAEKDQASTRLAISAYRDLLARYPSLEDTDAGAGELKRCRELLPKFGEEVEDPIPEAELTDSQRACVPLLKKQDLIDKGTKQMDACRRKLADHELYVAKFYMKRDKFLAAAARADALLRNYSGLGLDAVALEISARSHAALGNATEARVALEKLIEQFPDTREAADAADLLPEISAPPQTGSDAREN